MYSFVIHSFRDSNLINFAAPFACVFLCLTQSDVSEVHQLYWSFAPTHDPTRSGWEHSQISKKVLPPTPTHHTQIWSKVPPAPGGTFGWECSHPPHLKRVGNPTRFGCSHPLRVGLNTPRWVYHWR